MFVQIWSLKRTKKVNKQLRLKLTSEISSKYQTVTFHSTENDTLMCWCIWLKRNNFVFRRALLWKSKHTTCLCIPKYNQKLNKAESKPSCLEPHITFRSSEMTSKALIKKDSYQPQALTPRPKWEYLVMLRNIETPKKTFVLEQRKQDQIFALPKDQNHAKSEITIHDINRTSTFINPDVSSHSLHVTVYSILIKTCLMTLLPKANEHF